jgi:hypothetical protein
MKIVVPIGLFLLIPNCSGNQPQEQYVITEKICCVNSYDSAYWCYMPKIEKFTDSLTKIELDSMEMDTYQASKQVLKEIYINYWKRNEGNLDPAPEYCADDEEYEKEMSAILNCIYHHLCTHGYKLIDEESFKNRIELFYSHKWDEYIRKRDFYESEPGGCMNIPNYVSSLQKRVVYHPYANPIRLKIKGEKWLNDGYDNDMGVSINERMDMESFLNGELEFDNQYIQLDKILYQHLFVFNNNKAAKNWLLGNCIKFFFDELTCYDDDDEINRRKLHYMIKKSTNEYDEISFGADEYRLISRGLSGRNRNMMRLIFEETDKAMTMYENNKDEEFNKQAFELISEYLWIRWVEQKSISVKSYMHELDLLCMFAKMEVSLNKKHSKDEKYGWFNMEHTSRSYAMLSDTLLEIAKKNNYYDIPNFDEVLKVIEWDNEHDVEGEHPDKVPFDYTTLLSKDGEK